MKAHLRFVTYTNKMIWLLIVVASQSSIPRVNHSSPTRGIYLHLHRLMLLIGLILRRHLLCLNLWLTVGRLPALGFAAVVEEAAEVDKDVPDGTPLPDLCSAGIYLDLFLVYLLATPNTRLQPSESS
jgi:hypothetical protein